MPPVRVAPARCSIDSGSSPARQAVVDVDFEDILEAALASALLGLVWAGYGTAVHWMWRNRKEGDPRR